MRVAPPGLGTHTRTHNYKLGPSALQAASWEQGSCSGLLLSQPWATAPWGRTPPRPCHPSPSRPGPRLHTGLSPVLTAPGWPPDLRRGPSGSGREDSASQPTSWPQHTRACPGLLPRCTSFRARLLGPLPSLVGLLGAGAQWSWVVTTPQPSEEGASDTTNPGLCRGAPTLPELSGARTG